jgi:hypothetical protein
MKKDLIIDLQWFGDEGTKISDVIVPEVFNPYVVQRTSELSAIRRSGIAAAVPGIVVPTGGKTINMPFWTDLNGSGDWEDLSDSDPLSPSKIGADKDVAVVLARGKAWQANELAKAFAGSDPMGAIADQVAEYEAGQEQKLLLSVLKGIFASGGMTGNIHDISALAGDAAVITGKTLIKAIAKLGDAGIKLTGIFTHSAVMYDMAAQDLLDQIISGRGDGQNAPEFVSYLGRQIVVDDGAPTNGDVYTTYLFGNAAIGYNEGNTPTPTETDRDSLAGDDILIRRKHLIMHPRGVRWIGTAAGATPSKTELETGTNWERVYDPKAIRIVKFTHKLKG